VEAGRREAYVIFAAHQPQYLPWLGYLHKMAHCDVFVILDNVQYKKREYQNRNKIRTAEGSAWLTVPVQTKGRGDQMIREVRIDASRPWANDHWKSLQQHYRRAPYFEEHQPFFEALYTKPWDHLMDLNLEVIGYLRRCFNIHSVLYFESMLNISGRQTDRLTAIGRALGADVYLSGVGGRQYLEEAKFRQAGMSVRYQEFVHPVYPQVYPGFVPNLSAVDMLFNVAPSALSGQWHADG